MSFYQASYSGFCSKMTKKKRSLFLFVLCIINTWKIASVVWASQQIRFRLNFIDSRTGKMMVLIRSTGDRGKEWTKIIHKFHNITRYHCVTVHEDGPKKRSGMKDLFLAFSIFAFYCIWAIIFWWRPTVQTF